MIIKLPRYGGVFFLLMMMAQCVICHKNNPFVVVVVGGCVLYYNVWIISNLAESNVFDTEPSFYVFQIRDRGS